VAGATACIPYARYARKLRELRRALWGYLSFAAGLGGNIPENGLLLASGMVTFPALRQTAVHALT